MTEQSAYSAVLQSLQSLATFALAAEPPLPLLGRHISFTSPLLWHWYLKCPSSGVREQFVPDSHSNRLGSSQLVPAAVRIHFFTLSDLPFFLSSVVFSTGWKQKTHCTMSQSVWLSLLQVEGGSCSLAKKKHYRRRKKQLQQLNLDFSNWISELWIIKQLQFSQNSSNR